MASSKAHDTNHSEYSWMITFGIVGVVQHTTCPCIRCHMIFVEAAVWLADRKQE